MNALVGWKSHKAACLGRLEESQNSSKGNQRDGRSRDRPMAEFSDSNSNDDFDHGQRKSRRNVKPVGDAIKGIKMKIPRSRQI